MNKSNGASQSGVKIFYRRTPELKRLLQSRNVAQLDLLAEQQRELREIMPVLRPSRRRQLRRYKTAWAYFPWNRQLVRVLDGPAFRTVRLSRNRGLITDQEQQKFQRMRVGIIGLNVGYHAALCLALEGGAQTMKFADPDVLTLSSLNRFRSTVAALGKNKCTLTAEQVWEIDPFYDIELFTEGIQENNLRRFMLKPRLDVIIEEMDNLRLKLVVREMARRLRIPVVMVTGNGENLILDIERYDRQARLPILNGKVSQRVMRAIQKGGELPPREKVLLARDFIGQKHLVYRLQQSFRRVGKTLAGIPQIGETSFLRGLVLAQVVRKLSTGQHLPSGRWVVRMDNIFHT